MFKTIADQLQTFNPQTNDALALRDALVQLCEHLGATPPAPPAPEPYEMFKVDPVTGSVAFTP